MVIPFDRRFTDADRDPDLFEAIWANELPGVLNQALAGYKRLVERGARFKRPSPVKAATNLWLQHANPLPAFIEARCTKRTGSRCLVKVVLRGLFQLDPGNGLHPDPDPAEHDPQS